MEKKRILSILLTGAFVLGALGACTPAQQPQPPTEQVQPVTPTPGTPGTPVVDPPPPEAISRGLTVAIQAETPNIAPARHTSLIGHFKNVMTHNGLFRIHYEALEPVPDLVASWRAVSDTVFEFTIHEGILFHNGEEMTAEDIVASFEYVRTYPDTRANHTSFDRAEVVDRYTVRIDTGIPNAMLFFELAHQANFIMPRSLIDAGHDFTVDPVGSGPFVFDDWRFGDSLHFVAFENYFDNDRSPMIEYVNWRIIPEGASRTISLETREVDYIVEVAFPDIPRMQENPNITVFQRAGTAYNFLLLNNDLPYFNNRYVRWAIDMAIDKEAAVIASVDGFGIPIWENVPNFFPGASSEGIRSFDPDGARALLAEQGIDPANISFEMLTSSEEARRRAEVVQANLADIGIETTISMIDTATYLTVTQFGDYEAAFGAFTTTNLLSFLRGTSHIDTIDGQNRSRMYNRELSDLIDQAISTIDASARLAILEDASRIANEHIGFIPMHLSLLIRAFDSRLVAPEIAANGFMNFNMVYWTE